MTDEKPKRQRRKRAPGTTTRLSDQQLATMGEIFPGFDTWYKATHDEQGRMLPKGQIPGLTPQQYEGEEPHEQQHQ